MLTPRDAWFGDASNRSLGDSLTWIRTPSRRLRQCVALAARELTDYFSSLDHGNPVVMLSSLRKGGFEAPFHHCGSSGHPISDCR